jgi:hypothetical protein
MFPSRSCRKVKTFSSAGRVVNLLAASNLQQVDDDDDDDDDDEGKRTAQNPDPKIP